MPHLHRLVLAILLCAVAAPVTQAQPPPPPVAADGTRAQFSGKRLVLEILGSAVVGTLVPLAVYEASCDGEACVGAAMLSLATTFAVTPLTAWGIGSAMGGEGRLSSTYLFGLGGGGLGLIQPPSLGLALMIAFLPVTSALGYEASSNRWYREHQGAMTITPVSGGGVATLALTF